MSSYIRLSIVLVVCGLGLAVVQAAGVSEQQADAFDRKMAMVSRQASGLLRATAESRRTSFTEAEVNSWFLYRGREVLPEGVTAPRVTIVGDGLLRADAIVDLEAMGRRRSTGGMLNPWSYLGGRVPVSMSGVLHTANGTGRFNLERATVSGVPVPKSLLQDMVAYYSRTPDDPEGVRLEDPFAPPARIRQIEMRQGQAVVIQ